MDNRASSDYIAQEEVIESVIGRMFFIRPGVIKKFIPEKNMVEAQVAIKVKRHLVNGNVQYDELPLVVNVPIAIAYSLSSAMGTTFPIREGDPCTLLFSDRMINIFLKKGEICIPEENGQNNLTTVPRQHDIQDAICFPGMIVQSSVFKDWNNNAIEIRDLERKVYVSVSHETIESTDGEAVTTISGGKVTVDAPNNVDLTDGDARILIEDGKVHISAPSGLFIDAPNFEMDNISGRVYGNLIADNVLTNSGFDANGHRHSGVETGGGNTGPFV